MASLYSGLPGLLLGALCSFQSAARSDEHWRDLLIRAHWPMRLRDAVIALRTLDESVQRGAWQMPLDEGSTVTWSFVLQWLRRSEGPVSLSVEFIQ